MLWVKLLALVQHANELRNLRISPGRDVRVQRRQQASVVMEGRTKSAPGLSRQRMSARQHRHVRGHDMQRYVGIPARLGNASNQCYWP